MKRTRVNPVNRDRKAKAYARSFGVEADAVRAMRCVCNDKLCDELVALGEGVPDDHPIFARWCSGVIEPAHNPGIAAGGDRFRIAPLCTKHHAEQHQHGVKTFEAKYGLDLRAEADRVALEHEAPLGIRGLAARWLAHNAGDEWNRRDENGDILPPAEWTMNGWQAIEPLYAYELEALLGWVRRRMQTMLGAVDGYVDEGSGEIVGRVAIDLGLDDDVAWALCEAAGWPS